MRLLKIIAPLAALAVLAACSSAAPASSLDSGGLTCPDGSRACTTPGTVRWSIPVPGSYQIDPGSSDLDVRKAEAAYTSATADDVPQEGVHSAAFTGGRVITCAAGAVEAIDPGSGRVQWRRLAAQLRAHLPSDDPSLPADSADFCQLTVVAPGEVAVEFHGDVWILNVATGAAGRKITLPGPRDDPDNSLSVGVDLLVASKQVLSMLEDSTVYGLDRSSGAVRWRVRLPSADGSAVIGHVLYTDDGDAYDKKPATAIQRVDLTAGHRLPDLPLDRRLRGDNSFVLGQVDTVVAAAQPMSTLLVQSGGRDSSKISAIDPSTGHTRWTHPGGLAQIDQDAEPSQVTLLNVPVDADPGFDTPPARTLRTINVSTGKLVSTVKIARSVPSERLEISSENLQEESEWNYDDSLLIAYAHPTGKKAGRHNDWYTRLEGLDPATGQARWRGPWAGDVFVLGDAPRQHLIIAESCAPSGISSPQAGGDDTCTDGRLYAINT